MDPALRVMADPELAGIVTQAGQIGPD